MSSDETILSNTKATIEYVKETWTDSLGTQYILWLEQTLKKLQQIEKHREIIRLKAEKIRLLCEEIETTDDNPPKTLKKR